MPQPLPLRLQRPTLRQSWGRDLLLVAGLNTAVATLLLLMALGTGALSEAELRLSGSEHPWWKLLLYSQCIGFSIHGLGELPLLLRPAAQWKHPLALNLLRLAMVPLGFGLGTLVASRLLEAPLHLPLTWHPWDLLVVALTLLVSGVAILLTHQRDRLEAERLRAENAEMRATSARLQLLQQQIEPHMLFNTLANAHALVDDDPQQAQRLLEALSELLHASMQTGDRDRVSLQEEFTLAEHYLRLMGIRMGTRLRYELHLPCELGSVRLPPLILQPLVENAIKHGLGEQVQGGCIQVRAWQEERQLCIEVQDDGAGLQANARPSSRPGIGIGNVQQRLRYAFGPKASVHLLPRTSGGVQALLQVPLPAPAADRHD